MKKVVAVLMVLTMTLALLPGGAIAGTEDDPDVYELYAGQDIDVGQVEVWNDADTLYVRFVADGDWCISETHVHVFMDNEGFTDVPHKNGNPIPGQFDYSAEYDPCTANPEPYQIAFEWDLGKELYIAAHAVVVQGHSLTLQSSTATQTAGWFEKVDDVQDVDATYALSASNYSGGGTWVASTDISAPNAAWYNESDLAPAIWISSIDGREGSAGYDQWRLFKDEFEIPEWATNIEGSLQFTADNAVAAYLDDGEIDATTYVYGIVPPQPRDPELQHFRNLDGPSGFAPETGSNALYFVVRNYYGTGDNPTGLLYKADISYDQEETAWGDGEDFPGRNWATYITYTVQCPYEPELVNGGFETPTPTATEGWDIYDSGTDGLGWTVEWAGDYTDAPDPAHLEIHTSGVVVDAYEGSQYAELDTDWDGPGGGLNNEPASVKIYQDLDTCPGQTYTLEYAWSPRAGYGQDKVEVYWDGELLETHSGDTEGWNLVTRTVTASDWTTRLEFVETGNANSYGMFLDAVGVAKCDNCSP